MTFDRAALEDALAQIAVVSDAVAKTRQQLAVKLAPGFSIFDLIKYNENVISDIIAHFLNPQGSHSQGSRFLKAYLQMLTTHCDQANKDKLKNVLDALSCQDEAVVRREDVTKKGRRIDITVTVCTAVGTTKFGIENKLRAADQKDQVPDYLEDLQNGFLVYLSIEDPEKKLNEALPGRKEVIEAAVERGSLFLTQYKPHMDIWIDECLKIVESDKIRWYLNELQQLVNKFYGGNSYMYDNAIVEFLLNNKNALRAAGIATKNIGQVNKEIAGKYLRHIHDKLDSKIEEYKTNWTIVFDDGKSASKYWTPIRINKKTYDMSIRLEFDTESKCYKECIYGIADDRACENNGANHSHYFETIKEKVQTHFSTANFSSTQCWPCCKKFQRGRDWLNDIDITAQLHEYHIKNELSALYHDADIVVQEMFELLAMLDKFFKEEDAKRQSQA